MKKIVIFHHSNRIGGAGVSLLNVHKMLQDEYIVKTYIPDKESGLGLLFQKEGISVNEIKKRVGIICSYSGGSSFYGRTSLKSLIRIRETKKAFQEILNKEKPDIVAVNSMTLAWAGKLIKKNDCKSICFVRETFVNNLGMKYIKHCLNKYFDSVIFISNYDKDKMSCKAPVSGVVNNCVIKDDYQVNITKKDACGYLGIQNEFNILFVGGTNKLKGWNVIERAMEKLTEYKIRLIVAGNTEEVENKPNINFLGSRTDMPYIYKACDVLVFPSTSPHQARPVFEAGMMGLPVIISDFRETKEHVIDGENGLTFKPNNAADLALKIEKLYNDNELRERLGKVNKEYALKNHEFGKCKEKLLQLLEKLK
jgi:glycosyltransferase involved in cell wall biosynthesis